MTTKIYVNLPVKNLDESRAFFSRLGFEFEPQFSDSTAVCVIVADNIFVMLLTEKKFRMSVPASICDATQSTETLVCLSCETREKVDDLVQQAVAAGARTFNEPQDHGFMYSHSFQDLDGHVWELIFMEPTAVIQD